MKAVRVSVTEEDIRLGEPHNMFLCPVARAASRALKGKGRGWKGVVVTAYGVHGSKLAWWGGWRRKMFLFGDDEAVLFIRAFDRGGREAGDEAVKPFTFTMKSR
jgi:hypothetical protein